MIYVNLLEIWKGATKNRVKNVMATLKFVVYRVYRWRDAYFIAESFLNAIKLSCCQRDSLKETCGLFNDILGHLLVFMLHLM